MCNLSAALPYILIHPGKRIRRNHRRTSAMSSAVTLLGYIFFFSTVHEPPRYVALSEPGVEITILRPIRRCVFRNTRRNLPQALKGSARSTRSRLVRGNALSSWTHTSVTHATRPGVIVYHIRHTLLQKVYYFLRAERKRTRGICKRRRRCNERKTATICSLNSSHT